VKVLIADDDESIRWVLRKAVEGLGHAADCAADGAQALELLSTGSYAAAFVDIRMPELEGIELLERVQARRSPTRFFVMTAFRGPEAAARATREGAAEFLIKPFDIATVERLLGEVEQEAASRERPAHQGAAQEWGASRVVGRSRALLEVFKRIGRIADSDAPVLLTGERGVGKELIARCIHEIAGCRGPFVAVNCAAIPRELQEAELFGHEKGAFTGADAARPGRVEAAAEGTLFLDEIGDAPPDLQGKLLRLIQEREFTRLGSNEARPFRGRIVAATNRDLGRLAAEGRFREDLYDRLNVFPIRVPSLAERREDIPLLAEHFLQKYCALLSRPLRSFSREALEALAEHSWKGNVRELENLVQRLAVLAPGKLIRRADVACELAAAAGPADPSRAPLEVLIEGRIREFTGRLGRALHAERNLYALFVRQMERPLLRVVLEATGGNRLRAAALLGINRNTLRKKLAELGLSVPRRGGAAPR